MKKIEPDGKRYDTTEARVPKFDADRPSPSEAMIEFVKALARMQEKIVYKSAKAAWLVKQHTDC